MGSAAEEPSASERPWLWMPVACTICLIIACMIGSLRVIWRLSHSNAGSDRWCIKYGLRISSMLLLVAGAFGLLDAGRRFWDHRDLAREASIVFLVFPGLTYTFLVLAVLFAALGLKVRRSKAQAAEQAYVAVRQNCRISFLAGVAAGMTQEVLCGVDDKEFPMPDAWRESCQMLGSSCGLLLLGIFAAQADGTEKREEQPPEAEAAKKAEEETLRRQESASGSIGDPFFPRRDLFSSPQWARESPEQEDTTRRGRHNSLNEPLLQSPEFDSADPETGMGSHRSDDAGRASIPEQDQAMKDASRESREVFHTPAGGYSKSFYWPSPDPHETRLLSSPPMQPVPVLAL